MHWKQIRRICCACSLHTPLVPHTVSVGGGGDGGCDDDRDEATIDLRSGSQMLLYKLKRGQCGEVPPITIQLGAFNTGGFHSLVVSLVGAIQNNMLDSWANPTKRVSH